MVCGQRVAPGEMKQSLPLAELWLSQLEAVLGICSLHSQKDVQLVLILNTLFAGTVRPRLQIIVKLKDLEKITLSFLNLVMKPQVEEHTTPIYTTGFSV